EKCHVIRNVEQMTLTWEGDRRIRARHIGTLSSSAGAVPWIQMIRYHLDAVGRCCEVDTPANRGAQRLSILSNSPHLRFSKLTSSPAGHVINTRKRGAGNGGKIRAGLHRQRAQLLLSNDRCRQGSLFRVCFGVAAKARRQISR